VPIPVNLIKSKENSFVVMNTQDELHLPAHDSTSNADTYQPSNAQTIIKNESIGLPSHNNTVHTSNQDVKLAENQLTANHRLDPNQVNLVPNHMNLVPNHVNLDPNHVNLDMVLKVELDDGDWQTELPTSTTCTRISTTSADSMTYLVPKTCIVPLLPKLVSHYGQAVDNMCSSTSLLDPASSTVDSHHIHRVDPQHSCEDAAAPVETTENQKPNIFDEELTKMGIKIQIN